MAKPRRKPFKASKVRRKSKPAGTSLEPSPRVEGAHIGFMRSWAGEMNSIQRAHWPKIRKIIIAEQERLGTRTDAATRGDALPRSLRAVTNVVAEMLGQYAVKVRQDSKASSERVGKIEGALESTSSVAWAQNITSLIRQAPGIEAEEKTELADFVIDEEPDIPPKVRKAWIKEQLGLISGKPVAPVRVAGRLIETISGRSLKRLSKIVTEGILRGTRVEAVMKSLAELPGITKRHAELLARDQVVKQNGRMTRIRHEGIAVTHYTWQTVGDQRVRKTHRAFGRGGGQRYSYKKGAGPKGVNPAEEIQCRCWASPDLAGALANLRKRGRRDGGMGTRRVRARARISFSLPGADLGRTDVTRGLERRPPSAM